MRDLASDQAWFARAITTSESDARPLGAEDAGRRLTPGPRMTALERLEIYRRAYHRRLVECLADDYPALRHALGVDAFESLCRDYVARYPSRSPSLNAYGAAMAAFCRDQASAPWPNWAFASDLASLEWAVVEVIHARVDARERRDVERGGSPLVVDRLQAIPAERWGEVRLVATEALRLLRFDHPVNAYFQSFLDGSAAQPPGPAPSAVVVYRSGPTVWRMDLSRAMMAVLEALTRGRPLAEALEGAAEHLAGIDEAEAARRVMGWFRDWMASGFFTGLRFGNGPPR